MKTPFIVLVLQLAGVAGAAESPITGFVQVLPNCGCELNQEAIRCDQVAEQLKSMRLSAGFDVTVAIDDAPYETVVAVLDSLKENGIDHVFVMPPFFGTKPSASVKRWIRFSVHGQINHPFAMVMISTERFTTWRERMIVLATTDFATVDRLVAAKIAGGSCTASLNAVPKDLLGSENRLLIGEHHEGRTQTCLLPHKAMSCEFLAGVADLKKINWAVGEVEAIRLVASEIGCPVPALL